jgi:hypothetical protein
MMYLFPSLDYKLFAGRNYILCIDEYYTRHWRFTNDHLSELIMKVQINKQLFCEQIERKEISQA